MRQTEEIEPDGRGFPSPPGLSYARARFCRMSSILTEEEMKVVYGFRKEVFECDIVQRFHAYPYFAGEIPGYLFSGASVKDIIARCVAPTHSL